MLAGNPPINSVFSSRAWELLGSWVSISLSKPSENAEGLRLSSHETMVLRAGLQDLSCSIRTLLGCSQYAGHRGQQESDAWDRHQQFTAQFTAHFSMTCLRIPKEHKLFHRGPKLMWKRCEAPPSARSHLAQLHTQVILQSPPSLHLSKWLLLYLSKINSFEGSSKERLLCWGNPQP